MLKDMTHDLDLLGFIFNLIEEIKFGLTRWVSYCKVFS